jgi:hypothetical protein
MVKYRTTAACDGRDYIRVRVLADYNASFQYRKNVRKNTKRKKRKKTNRKRVQEIIVRLI